MGYRFEFRPYGRRFKPPLQTSYGTWEVREGIILRLTDESQVTEEAGETPLFSPSPLPPAPLHSSVSLGEIAPISWFGSETLEQALDFCHQLPSEVTEETIFSIPPDLPACQFGFESAWEALKPQPPSPPAPQRPIYSGLLPAGEAALHQWQILWNQGYRTFKWKIGVYPIADELEIFHLLTRMLPASAKLRLDANGGLNYDEANLWLWTCDNVRATDEGDELPLEIEFIEQPLPVDQFEEMLELSTCYATSIALDESVATLDQLEACYQQGWRKIFVIKAAIAGSPKRLRQFCQKHKIDAVFSSVFETTVGRQAALNLAAELSSHNRAVGFGVNHWFNEDETWLKRLWNDR